jgi:hypothetical protein
LDIAEFDEPTFRPTFEATFKRDLAAGYALLEPSQVSESDGIRVSPVLCA